jgi:hypothetical protein
LLSGALVAASLLASPAAWSAPLDLAAAKALFKQAEADERAERWDKALEKLRKASTVKMTAGIRFHIAVCEEKLGHLVAALDDYTAAQSAARETDNREVLGLASEPLLALKTRLPTLTVSVPPELRGNGTLEVRVDGALLPATSIGSPVPLDPGAHTLEATAAGQSPYSTTFTVEEREARPIVIPFTPPPAPVLVARGPEAPPPPPTLPAPPPRPSRGLAIAATAGAVVLIAGGVGAFAAAGSDQSYWRTACMGQGQGCGNATPVRTWDAVALGAWVGGAVAAGTAIVLWTRAARSADSAQATVSAGPGRLSLSGTF